MGETGNISKIAEILSNELFSEFGWEREGPLNVNWKCINAEHGKKTHPSDVVFSYKEPYERKRTYINCDLKSYSKDSITPSKIKTALDSLAVSINCAKKSEEWQTHYLRDDETAEIVGMLFIYNHDGLYDKDFENQLNNAVKERIPLEKGERIYVFSPNDIKNLSTIVNDIVTSRGKDLLPKKDNCSFYYPDQMSRIVVHREWNLASTLEMLKSSLIILKYKNEEKSSLFDGLVIYYNRPGTNVEEFIYLIDYLFHWQLIQENISIIIKLTNGSDEANAVFSRAIKDYKSRYNIDDEANLRLKDIKIEKVTRIVTEFSSVEIGMEEVE